MSGGFLDRWSRRKLATAGKALLAESPAPPVSPAPAAQPEGLAPAGAFPSAPPAPDAEAATPSAGARPLPPIDELTLASDFTAFLKEEVSEALRRKALQKLFADPHFNRMDGLDIYIDDYSLPDPIPPEAMAKLTHAREWLMANEAGAEAEPESNPAAAEAEAEKGERSPAGEGSEADPAAQTARVESGAPGGADASGGVAMPPGSAPIPSSGSVQVHGQKAP